MSVLRSSREFHYPSLLSSIYLFLIPTSFTSPSDDTATITRNAGAVWSIGHIHTSHIPRLGHCGIRVRWWSDNGVYVYGRCNMSSQIRGADGECVEKPIRKALEVGRSWPRVLWRCLTKPEPWWASMRSSCAASRCSSQRRTRGRLMADWMGGCLCRFHVPCRLGVAVCAGAGFISHLSVLLFLNVCWMSSGDVPKGTVRGKALT